MASDVEPAEIGPKLRARRKALRMTLQEVAEASDLTRGFLSRLERGHSSLSVASLVRLCNVLDIKIATLFEPGGGALVKAGQAPLVNFGGREVKDRLLTPASERDLQVLESDIGSGGGSGDELYTLNSSLEFVHVLEGKLTVTVGSHAYDLGAGDSLTFDPGVGHTWNASPGQGARVLWVLTPAP